MTSSLFVYHHPSNQCVGTLVPDGVIVLVVRASALTWFIRYIYFFCFTSQSLKLSYTYVTVAKFGHRCSLFRLLAFKCKYVNHILHCLKKQLSIDSSLGNLSYTPSIHKKDEIRDKSR